MLTAKDIIHTNAEVVIRELNLYNITNDTNYTLHDLNLLISDNKVYYRYKRYKEGIPAVFFVKSVDDLYKYDATYNNYQELKDIINRGNWNIDQSIYSYDVTSFGMIYSQIILTETENGNYLLENHYINSDLLDYEEKHICAKYYISEILNIPFNKIKGKYYA